jgi:hypothetical protein
MTRTYLSQQLGRSLDEQANEAFALITAAAAAGERCPMNAPHGPVKQNAVSRLVKQGRIKVLVYTGNWRVAMILQGPHAGKHTLKPTDGRSLRMINGERAVRRKS